MKSNLYDEKGYHIQFTLSKSYNMKKNSEDTDTRNLGIFIKYVGPAVPVYANADHVYTNDAYVMSRLDLVNGSIWNPNAATGFFEPESEGIWTGKISTLNIKEPGIGKSGLKIEYLVPEQMRNENIQIHINNELIADRKIIEPGEYSEVFDVSQIGKEEIDYIEKAHKILMILLKEIDRICEKYDLHYYLICGSLLGTVRGKQLIPWDDDVDVAMTRKDFDKFVECTKAEWKEKEDFLFIEYNQMGNHAFLDFMTRVVYMKEEIPIGVYRKIHGKGRNDIENHMPVDIYVMDNAYKSDRKHKLQTNVITLLYGLAIGHRAYIDYDEYARKGKKTQLIVKILSKVGKCIPLKLILFSYEKVRKWNKNDSSDDVYESNGFIYCIPWKFKRKWFGDGVRLQLEDMMVRVPSDYESFLKMHYWDYMQLPPMEARKPTHSINSSGIF